MVKLVKYTKYINILSFVIFVAIIITTLFGCNNVQKEEFQNNKEHFVNSIIHGIQTGTIDIKTMEKYIRENNLTKEDLERILASIETNN